MKNSTLKSLSQWEHEKFEYFHSLDGDMTEHWLSLLKSFCYVKVRIKFSNLQKIPKLRRLIGGIYKHCFIYQIVNLYAAAYGCKSKTKEVSRRETCHKLGIPVSPYI